WRKVGRINDGDLPVGQNPQGSRCRRNGRFVSWGIAQAIRAQGIQLDIEKTVVAVSESSSVIIIPSLDRQIVRIHISNVHQAQRGQGLKQQNAQVALVHVHQRGTLSNG